MTEVTIRTRGRAHVCAELAAPAGVDDQLAFAGIAVDAIFALGAGLFQPLAVDVELVCCDRDTGYPLDEPRPAAPFHQLRLASPPETVAIREVWEGTELERRETLDRDRILDWIGAIVTRQRCLQPDTTTGWAELRVEAVRARLPGTTRIGTEQNADEVPVSYGAGVIRYPVERFADAVWVAGPLATNPDTAPFELRIANEAGYLSLDLSVNWSPWIDADGTGRSDIEAAAHRLSNLGWAVTTTHAG